MKRTIRPMRSCSIDEISPSHLEKIEMSLTELAFRFVTQKALFGYSLE
jgi:hypothetical protein